MPGKVDDFSLVLDLGNDYVFHPGDQVTGSLCVTLMCPMAVDGLEVSFKGRACCWWKGADGKDKMKKDNIFDRVAVVCGESQSPSLGRTTTLLPTGRHVFPFAVVLSQGSGVCSSYDGKHGFVRYTLIGSILRPWRSNKHTTLAVEVQEIVDVDRTELLGPAVATKHHRLTALCCCPVGAVTVTAQADSKVSYQGNNITLAVQCRNNSRFRIAPIQVRLLRLVTHVTKKDSFTTTDVLSRTKGPGLEARSSVDWGGVSMAVPHTAVPSTVAQSATIRVTYAVDVRLRIHVNAFQRNRLSVNLPITVAAVPRPHVYDLSSAPVLH